MPAFRAVRRVGVVLPHRLAKVPRIRWLRGWRLGHDGGRYVGRSGVDRSRLDVSGLRLYVWLNVNRLRCALLACGGADHSSGQAQKQQGCNPARIVTPTLVAAMLALRIMPSGTISRNTSAHGGKKKRDCDRFCDCFHIGPWRSHTTFARRGG